MTNVEIKIRNSIYTISCNDNEREHILTLARTLDNRLASIEHTVGKSSDIMLLIINSLMMADQLSQAQAQLAALDPTAIEDQMLQTLEAKLQQKTQVIISQVIDSVIEKLEELGNVLENS